MRKLIISLALLTSAVSMTSSSVVLAAGDVAAGKAKAANCAACHGADGISTQDMFPNLKGQKATYIKIALNAYKDGTRNNAIMSGMASSLSDADIDDVAAYFSSL